ncbi:beta-lactamase-like protein [Crepidotus variabilis]|uniref:Beta-lactamase-like protein n=1 Tax=Crepidotus variabilis TaxID=179855 RepID=A0A9P6JR65_9AGAR|nr:beta-lactamase-like protein [Crepidotus variabilis]
MSTLIKKVDKLTITFLVDNTIEWMTKLPPGFTHEVRQHLAQKGHGTYDEKKCVPVLDFENFCCGAHGFAALIETSVEGEKASHLTLFDTGPDSQSLVRNIKAMQVPVERITRVITSHWHSDHTGGLLSFLALRSSIIESTRQRAACIVDVHPDRPIARGIAPPPFDKVICAIPRDPTFEEIKNSGGDLEEGSVGHSVAGDTIWVSGEIPRKTDYEVGLLGGVRWVVKDSGSGSWVTENHIMDERYIVVDVVGKGLVIFSACSHAGIVNVVKDAVDTFKRPIHMIIGGLHLAGPESAPIVPKTVRFLSTDLKPAPAYVLPMHCSGFHAKVALEKALGEGCVPAGVGHKVVILGDRAIDDRLPATAY